MYVMYISYVSKLVLLPINKKYIWHESCFMVCESCVCHVLVVLVPIVLRLFILHGICPKILALYNMVCTIMITNPIVFSVYLILLFWNQPLCQSARILWNLDYMTFMYSLVLYSSRGMGSCNAQVIGWCGGPDFVQKMADTIFELFSCLEFLSHAM